MHTNDETKVTVPNEATAPADVNEAADTIKKEVAECKQALAGWQEKYMRLVADFENYKKRSSKEQATWAQMARTTIIADLLPIIDNFDRAMAHKKNSNDTAELQSWMSGIAMIYQSFHDFLKKVGVREVPYDTFDPHYHEALVQVESDKGAGHIVEVLEKGYQLDEQVLRPAKVSVGK
jgi:molecular chaperone GrpE